MLIFKDRIPSPVHNLIRRNGEVWGIMLKRADPMPWWDAHNILKLMYCQVVGVCSLFACHTCGFCIVLFSVLLGFFASIIPCICIFTVSWKYISANLLKMSVCPTVCLASTFLFFRYFFDSFNWIHLKFRSMLEPIKGQNLWETEFWIFDRVKI